MGIQWCERFAHIREWHIFCKVEDGFGDFESEMKEDKTSNQILHFVKSENETNELVYFTGSKKWVTLCLMIFKSSRVLDSIVTEWITFNHYIPRDSRSKDSTWKF